MNEKVKSFAELEQAERESAGGKGGTLAHLYQAGYPVPDGFVILPAAFIGDELSNDGWLEVKGQLARLRNGANTTSFAVRSSALSEDSAQASFAGEFETVLDVHTDEMIREAIGIVRRSRLSERVQAYSEAKGMELDHDVGARGQLQRVTLLEHQRPGPRPVAIDVLGERPEGAAGAADVDDRVVHVLVVVGHHVHGRHPGVLGEAGVGL